MSASPEEDQAHIELGWSSQRLKLRDATEDWTGITNQTERRRLQNRLNQRARSEYYCGYAEQWLIVWPGMRARGKDPASSDVIVPQERLRLTLASDEDGSDGWVSSNSSPVGTTKRKLTCLNSTPRVQELMRRFADHAYASYVQGAPALSHLNLLVRYNVSSALLRNADILGVANEYCKLEGMSPFFKDGPVTDLAIPQRSVDWPANLQPTPIQCSIEHHPWLDVFPWPHVRNNMLQVFEHLGIDGEDELCHDVSQYEGHDSDPMLVVWGDAWNPQCWETTPEFLKKWGYLFSGCEEALEATNYWRIKRDERPITRRQLHEAILSSVPEQFRHAVL